MAFPTGSIADNTVYKIGNRAWVYDSTLGVWDQVADNDTDASNLSGTLGRGITMSGVTFPAGHIVQTTSVTSGTTETVVSSNNNQFTDTTVQGSITPLYSNSDIAVYVSFQVVMNDTGGDSGVTSRFKKTVGSTVTFPADLTSLDSGSCHSIFYRNAHQYTAMVANFSHAWLDTTGNTAHSASSYILQGAQYNVSSTCQFGGPYDSRWHIWFQEISI